MRTISVWLPIVVVLALMMTGHVGAVETVTPVQTISDGSSYAIKAYSNNGSEYMLLSAGGSLLRYNVSNISNLSAVNWDNEVPDTLIVTKVICDIQINNSIAYILTEGYLAVIDLNLYSFISNFTTGYVGSECKDGGPHGTIKNQTLYVSTFGQGTSVISIANTSNLVKVNSIPVAACRTNLTLCNSADASFNRTWGINASGNKLFIGNNFRKPATIDIYDISNETNPVFLSSWNGTTSSSQTYAYVSDIKTVNNITYVVKYYNGFYILNTTNDVATEIYRTPNVDALGPAYDQYVSVEPINSSRIVFSLRYMGWLKTFDMSNPASPITLWANPSSFSIGYTESVSYLANKIYVNSVTYGGYVVNASNLSNLFAFNAEAKGHRAVTGSIFSGLMYNNSLYLGSRNDVIGVYDVNLTPKDRIVVTGRYYSIDVVNNTMYLTAATGGIITVDVSEQYVLKNITEYPDYDTYSKALIVDNKYMYAQIGAAAHGIYEGQGFKFGVYDISNNSVQFIKGINMTELSEGELMASTLNSIVLYNNTTILYSAAGGPPSSQGGFTWVDITNRSNPTIIKKSVFYTTASMAGYGDFIFDNVTNIIYGWNSSSGSFEIANITDMNYSRLGYVSRGGVNYLTNGFKVGNGVYFAGSPNVEIYNVAQLTNPILSYTFEHYGSSPSAFGDSNGAFIADTWGLYKLDLVEFPAFYIFGTNASTSITSATVTYSTNEASNSTVYYGTASGVYTQVIDDSNIVTSHSIGLNSLNPSTLYYYIASATNSTGSRVNDTERTFTTTSSGGVNSTLPTGFGNRMNVSGSTTFYLDDINTKARMNFTAQKNGTINGVLVRASVRTGVPPNYTYGLRNSTGDLVSNVSHNVTATSSWTTITIPEYVSTINESLSIVIEEVEGYEYNASNRLRFEILTPQLFTIPRTQAVDLNYSGQYYINSTGLWSTARTPEFGIRYTDGTYEGQPWVKSSYAEIDNNSYIREHFVMDRDRNISRIMIAARYFGGSLPLNSMKLNISNATSEITNCSIANTSFSTYNSFHSCDLPSNIFLSNNTAYNLSGSSEGSTGAGKYAHDETYLPFFQNMTFNSTDSYMQTSTNGVAWTSDLNQDWVFLLVDADVEAEIPSTLPNITSYSPENLTFSVENNTFVGFTAEANQTIITWNWMGVDESLDNTASKTFTSNGSVSVSATNANGTSPTITWTVTVLADSPPTFVPPTPISLSQTNSSTGFWINYTWTAGTEGGNITDSYNVSVNGTWTNGTNPFNNGTVAPHGWRNISVYAYNSSGTGTLNETPTSMNTQLPATISINTTINCLYWCFIVSNTTQTLLQIDNNYTTDTSQGLYNSTSQKYETHIHEYTPNQNSTVIPKQGYSIYMKSSTQITTNYTTNPTITLNEGWNLVGNINESGRTLSALKSAIGVSAIQATHYNITSQTWISSDSENVPSGESFFVYITPATTWSG